ncbi:hypothetical protein KAZ92_02555 [Candidatus Gracilibacteria bacterium]|nr:hypothetical protein [Candidatus Gracilibacteria bacterium]
MFHMFGHPRREDFRDAGRIIEDDPFEEEMKELVRETAVKAYMMVHKSGAIQALTYMRNLEGAQSHPTMVQAEFEAWKIVSRHVREMARTLLGVTDTVTTTDKISKKNDSGYISALQTMNVQDYMSFGQELLMRIDAYKMTL